jgi:exodeoxyribonuclease V alpha subunit
MMTRNLLYTAITRGKRLVVLCGSKYAVQYMVGNNYIALRYSALAHFLTTTGKLELLDNTTEPDDTELDEVIEYYKTEIDYE